MTAYIRASLYGTEADDVLAYSSEYDPDEDTFTMYTSLYGLGGNDAIQIDGSDYSLYIDAGEGDDRIIGDQGFFWACRKVRFGPQFALEWGALHALLTF